MTTPVNPVWAVLPVKTLGSAKQRLRDVLSPDERQAFMIASLSDILREIGNSTLLSGLLVVSKDPIALDIAQQCGAEQLVINADSGQSDAISQGVTFLRQHGVSATLTIPGDTPLVTAADIDAVCGSLREPTSLTIVGNSDNTGTNCIGTSTPDLIPYQFGRNSLSRHLNSARSAGIEPTVLRLPRFELDIDTADDIAALMQQPQRTATQQFLASAQ